ncbi:MAG TPA: hypothetical protein PLN41_10085 [Methanothrix sp.]|nr:hypothetical protein [Methanothrix sp.]
MLASDPKRPARKVRAIYHLAPLANCNILRSIILLIVTLQAVA